MEQVQNQEQLQKHVQSVVEKVRLYTASSHCSALGADIRIKTVDGEVIYNVKPGTKTDTKVRLKGKGVPSLRNPQVRGDHYVTLVIQTPEKLSHEAKEALRKFDELAGNTLNQAGKNDGEKEKPEKKKKGFMDKVKEAFDD